MGDFGADRGLAPNAGGYCPQPRTRYWVGERFRTSAASPLCPPRTGPARAEKGHSAGPGPQAHAVGVALLPGPLKRCAFSRDLPLVRALFPEGHGPEP